MKNLLYKSTYLFICIASILITACSNTDNTYQKDIKTADSLFTLQQFEAAKKYYTKALNLKREEKYPQKQIAKINTAITKIKEDKYLSLLQKADSLYTNKNYSGAKKLYLNASNFKPNEESLKTKIDRIDKLMTDQKRKADKPFHVIVGSYSVESNAVAHQKRLATSNIQSNIKISREGNHLISIKSFKSINKAYNYLDYLENNNDPMYKDKIWIYHFYNN
ncbi:MAG: hypothetical protein HWD85_06770 [Flavobacteriaceae bacterium]|nr:hypothetical protein [Flavobacteriaceae bacterium]